MNTHRTRRRDAQALVDGRTPSPEYEAIARVLDGMRHDATAWPAPAPRPRLAATLDGRRPLRSASDPIPSPRRTPFIPRLRALRPATIAIASGAVFFGGLATAGALPGPLQHVSADLTQHVGIHLPGAAPAPIPAPHRTPGTGTAPPAAPGAANARPAATDGGHATSGTTPRGSAGTPATGPAAKQPTAPTSPAKTPVTLPGAGTVTVPVAGEHPPVVVTSPSLPIELPPVTLPTLPRHHDK